MGGKGGGDGGGMQNMVYYNTPDGISMATADYMRQYSPGTPTMTAAELQANGGKWPDPVAAPAAPAAAAPAPQADVPAPAAPAPQPDAPVPADPTPSGPAADAGGAVTQPTAADNPEKSATGGLGASMGGAVTTPPKYWVGGLDQYAAGNPAKATGTGRIKTTSTST